MSKTKSSAEFNYPVRSRGQTAPPRNAQTWPRPAIPVNRAVEHKTTFSDSDEQLSKLLEAAEIVVWEADSENFEFNYVSEEAVNLAGYDIDQWYQPDFFASHIHPDDCERVLAIRWNHHRRDQRYDFEFRMLAKDKHVVWIRNLAEVVDDDGRMRGFMIDITDRKRVEETLRVLGGRLISAQEDERSRVARELHDDVNQRMALLSIHLEQLQQDQEKSLDVSQRFQNLKTQVQEISNDIHRLSYVVLISAPST